MKKVSRKGLMATVLGICFAALSLQASVVKAQDQYPSQAIRIVIPYPAGGGTDTIGRLVGAELSKELNTMVWADNKPGASGTIGNNIVAKADPDGYTVLLGITALVQAPWLYKNLPYDVSTDLKPVSQLARSSDVFVVKSDLPVNTMAEFIALVKNNPGKYSYGSYGNGTSSHIHGEQFKLINQIDLMHVPYRGSGPAVADTVGGQVQVLFDNLPSSISHVQGGNLTAMAVAWPERLPDLPEIPTYKELGYESLNQPAWYGLLAPAGTPADIVETLHKAAVQALQDPKVKESLSKQGAFPSGNTPEEFAAEIKAQYDWAHDIVKKSNIELTN